MVAASETAEISQAQSGKSPNSKEASPTKVAELRWDILLLLLLLLLLPLPPQPGGVESHSLGVPGLWQASSPGAGRPSGRHNPRRGLRAALKCELVNPPWVYLN